MRLAFAFLALGVTALSACQPASAPSSSSAAAPAQAASFSVDALGDNEWSIQGCTTMLSRVGAATNAGLLFAEDGVENGAIGFIKINGTVLNVALTSKSGGETGPTVRTFADTAHTVQVVETTTTGAAHEESDSVEQSGTLAVTFGGATQTIPVDGGTAC